MGVEAIQAAQELAKQGVTLEISQVEEGALLSATYHGLTRSMLVTPNQEVRLITHPQGLFRTAGLTIADQPLLVITEDNNINIAALQFEPKAVTTARFLWGSDQNHPLQQKAEAIARQRGQLNGIYKTVEFTEEERHGLGISATETRALVKEGPQGLMWTAARNAAIAKRNVGTFLGNENAFPEGMQAREKTAVTAELTQTLKSNGDVVVSRDRQTIPNQAFDLQGYVTQVLSSKNVDLQAFLTHHFTTEKDSVGKGNLRKVKNLAPTGLLDSSNGDNETDILIEYATAQKVLELRERVLLAAGSEVLQGMPFDVYAQRFLTQTRENVQAWNRNQLQEYLSQTFAKSNLQDYKKIINANTSVLREQAAWILADAQARQDLMTQAEQPVTRAQLDQLAKISNVGRRDQLVSERKVSLVTATGERVGVAELFPHGEVSIFSATDFASLPLRPAVMPTKNTENMSSKQLAETIFDEILFSRLVVDRESIAQNKLSPQAREAYITKVQYAIDHQLPIEASQYAPLIAIGNPLKRVSQQPGLADIDMIRRLANVSLSVELVYPPGLRWTLVNEVPAFQAPEMLNLDSRYVDNFHRETARLVQLIDPSGKRIRLMKMTDFLTADNEKRRVWEAYREAKMTEINDALHNPANPLHQATTAEIMTFAYPMATCTNPYQFEAAYGLSTQQVTEVYEAIKNYTHSEVGGVGLSANGASTTVDSLSPQARALFHELLARGIEMAKIYRVTMSSRDVLRAFKDTISPHTVAYTMVTKSDKMVLHPNSGHGAFFPAHGEAVLIPPHVTNPNDYSIVTVRPWKDVAANANYIPHYDPSDRSRVLYWTIRAV